MGINAMQEIEIELDYSWKSDFNTNLAQNRVNNLF
jgi:hypothetical protein